MEINSSKKARYREIVHKKGQKIWNKDAHEIDVKVKNLNMHFEAWMDDAE